MMMKNLIKTLGFILALAGPSVTMAATSTDHPQTTIQDNIINTACIQREGGSDCDTVTISPYACYSISSTGTTVTIDSDDKGRMKFTCTASDTSVGHDFIITCGNDTYKTGHRPAGDSQSFTHTCVYNSGDFGKTFNVSCIVDDDMPTNPACKKGINVGYGIFGACGDGVIDTNEDCDFIGMNTGTAHNIVHYLNDSGDRIDAGEYTTANGYYCLNCKLIKSGGFVYEPAECFSTDKPISVMIGEIIPFWWKLNVGVTTNNITVAKSRNECNSDRTEDDGTLIYPIDCHFAVYNGTHKQGDDQIQRFTIGCYNTNYNDYDIYRYFEIHGTEDKADGASVSSVNAYIDGNLTELGEYKIVLETVEYDVCNPINKERETGKRSGPVCEVNTAITRPYAMQISTFGASPISTTDGGEFLSDFMDMQGNKLISSSTDLESIINIEDTEYSNEQNVQEEVEKFRNKYEKLAVKLESDAGGNNTILSKLSQGGVTAVKKVPNKNIYFLYGNSDNKITLTSGTFNGLPAYTIFVEGMDVEIKGNLLQYAMVITTERMSFKDGGPVGSYANISRCASGGQVVQGLYVAGQGFKAADEALSNISSNKLWCPWGGLHVKGALIGEGIENIVGSKRSQLNSWFNVNSNPMRERRQKIIGGASVLIEYSPSLWKTLPPGAEVFTESLEVYRK